MKRIAIALALVAMASAACKKADQSRTADSAAAADSMKMMSDSAHMMSDSMKMMDTTKHRP